ncbi:MAG: TonB-dependent receptor plug domain-containing protein, partial [Opitutaceae bacterium]
MNKYLQRLLIVSTSAIATVTFVRAQAVAIDATTLAKYDINKNGRLDPEELAAKAADEAKAAKTPVTNTDGPKGEEIIALSPFTVDAGADNGYFGANTMSGTRLNSKIEDLAASITVVTKQQMMDTAAVDINDIFNFEANTEGMNDFNNYAIDRNGNPLDQSQANPESSNRIRGVGAANIARGGFSSNSAIPIDTYNIDAVEISRGPNSNIFGVGDAAGTVNVVSSRGNVTRETTTIGLRGDTFGGFRTNIDINRPIIRGKLGLRILSVHEDKGYTRKPSVDRTNRLQVAINARPFRNTSINASYESYHNFARRPNSVSPRDGISEWLASGSPTYNPLTALFTFADGRTITRATSNTITNPTVQLNGGGVRPSIFVDQNGVGLWTVNRPAAATFATPNNTGGNADLQLYQSRPVYGNLS